MIKIAVSGLVGFAIGAGVTSTPVLTLAHHETVGASARAAGSSPASVDPFALTRDSKDLVPTDVVNYF